MSSPSLTLRVSKVSAIGLTPPRSETSHFVPREVEFEFHRLDEAKLGNGDWCGLDALSLRWDNWSQDVGTHATNEADCFRAYFPSVFAHISNVLCLQTQALDCVGCHFAQPFRAACDQGCSALIAMTADQVFSTALKLI